MALLFSKPMGVRRRDDYPVPPPSSGNTPINSTTMY